MSTDERQKQLQRDQGRRLRAAREHLGLSTAVKGAEFLKLPNSTTYSHHENGTRGMGRAASDYAAKFGVSEEWLLYGRNPPDWAVGDVEAAEQRSDDGHYLAAWRTYRRLTVEDLADRVGVPAETIYAWEAYTIDISTKWLGRLADALQTSRGAIVDVDPGATPSDLVDMWVDQSKQQKTVRAQLKSISRTGTDG